MPKTFRTRHSLAFFSIVLALALPACGDESGDSGGGKSANGQPSTETFDITGRWEGTLHQLGLGSFKVEAEIRSLDAESADENTVSYTVIDCSGTWEYLSMNATSFRFREVIDAGEGGACKGEGTVTLSPEGDDELGYSFSGEGVESRGTLTAAGR